jgi:hypothetical protein
MLLTWIRKALIVVLLLTTQRLCVFAQKNFIAGFVVTRNKDTLRGQIDFRDWDRNPGRIVFHEGENGTAMEYSAPDLAAFCAGDHRYESYTVHVFPYSNNPEELSSEQGLSAPYDTTIFLRVLTTGKVTLWEDRADAHTSYYFVSGKGGNPEQLRVITRISTVDGLTKYDQVAQYRNQLRFLLQDCEKTAGRIDRTEYQAGSLEKLIFAYNNCGRDTVEKRPNRGKILLFPIVGFTSSTLRFKGNDLAAYEHYKASPGLFAGAGALFIVPRNREKLSFLADLGWQHLHSVSDPITDIYSTNTGYIDYSLVKLDILFRYRYPAGGIRPFVEGGISNGLALGLNCYQRSIDRMGNFTYTEPMLGGSLRKHQEGWLLGAGIGGKRWTFEGRFESSSGISELTDVESPVKTWNLLVSYVL